MTQPERFWAKVRKSAGCWSWTASLNDGGYGQFWLAGKVRRAHRVAYLLAVGPIPDGKVLHHTCGNRACVNPGHLLPVTTRENLMAPGSLAPAKRNAEKTVCSRGHKFTPANTYRRGGARVCRACKREDQRRKAAA